MTNKFDIYQTITDRIIEQLKGGHIPWNKPWRGVNTGAYNRISKQPYSLLNQMLLKYDGEYASFKQWKELCGHIKKGEKSEIVVYWNIIDKKVTNKDGEEEVKHIPILKYYNVFHISQVEGVEPLEKPLQEVTPIEQAEKIILEYVSREGIKYTETISNKAYYSPLADAVVVPSKNQYKNANEFYSTAYHELVHSTGHYSRLARISTTDIAAFGSHEYSKEELVAEIGSATLMNRMQLETVNTFRNTAAYIQSWLKVLKNDNRFIVSAASKAEKAVNYILGV